MAKFTITLDMYKGPRVGEPVFIRVGDKSTCEVSATITEDGVDKVLDGLQARFECFKPDGHVVISEPFDVEGSVIEYAMPEQVSLAEGRISLAYFSLIDSTGHIDTTQSSVTVKVAETANYLGGSATCTVELESALEIVTWASGTDEQIAAMVAAADAGQITLSDYWSAGDTRTVHLSAMSGSVSNANESHAAQDVQMVLTDPGHYTLANGKKCNFVVLQKDCLKEYGVMNSQNTNSGGWNSCPRRTWCNSVYRNAIPSTLRGIFKQFTTYAANGTGSTSVASSDYFALFSEKEVFGSTTYANSSAESKNSQLTWFKTSSNRIKKVNGSASAWWERSPYSGYSYRFCGVTNRGNADWNVADGSGGLAPFGCI